MRELSQSIRVVPVRDLPSGWSGDVTALLTLGHTYHSDPFDLQPEPVEGTGGECYDLSKEHIIDTCEPHPFEHPLSSIVIYRIAHRDGYVMVGTRELPASVSIVRGLNSCTLKIACRMLRSPF